MTFLKSLDRASDAGTAPRRGRGIKEMRFDREGVSVVGILGKIKRRPWSELVGIDFRDGVLLFQDDIKVVLFGPVGRDTTLLVRVPGPESRLASTWERYWAAPRLECGVFFC